MTNYKYFLKLASRKSSLILIYLSIFIAISLLNSGNINDQSKDFESYKPTLGVINKDHGTESKSFLKYLSANTRIADYQLKEENAKEAIYNEVVSGLLVIPEHFSQTWKAGNPKVRLYYNENNERGALLNNHIHKYFLFANANYKTTGKMDHQKIQVAMNQEATVSYTSGNQGTASIRQWYQKYFSASPYIYLSLFVTVIGLIMKEYNQEALKSRTDILPISSSRFSLEQAAGQVTVALILLAVVLTFGYFYKPQYNHLINWPAHILNTLCFSASALALSILISTISTNPYFIKAISNITALGLSFISGVFLPLDLVPQNIQTIAHFFPVIYHSKATDLIMLGKMPWQNMGIMLLFAVAYLVLVLSIHRIRQGQDIL